MKIVNAHLANSIQEQGMLKEPNASGYILIASELELLSLFSSNSSGKNTRLSKLKSLCKALDSSSSLISRAEASGNRSDHKNAFTISRKFSF